jgi:hypothetical protein
MGGMTKKPMTVKRTKKTAAPMIHFLNRPMVFSVGVHALVRLRKKK